MNNKLLLVLGFVGSIFAILSGTVLIRPSLLDLVPFLGLKSISSFPLVLALILLFTFFGLFFLKRSTVKPEEVLIRFNSPPELSNSETSDNVLDFQFENYDEARENLSSIVKFILENSDKDNRSKEIIERGYWTDDSVSAAFVSENLNYSLVERLRGWLEDKGTLDRRIRRTVKSIEKLYYEEER